VAVTVTAQDSSRLLSGVALALFVMQKPLETHYSIVAVQVGFRFSRECLSET
jgi:hypothetical protein